MNDLGWKVFNALFPRTLESFSRRFASTFYYVNETACRMLGYSRNQLTQMGVTDLDPDYQETHWREHFAQLKADLNIRLETTHRASDGRVIPVEVSANYLNFEGQEYNCAIVRDISERKAAEAKLQQHMHLLESAQNAAHLGYFLTDLASGQWISSAMLDDIMGIGATYDRTVEGWSQLVHPEDRQKSRAEYELAVQRHEPLHHQYRIVRPRDGEIVWVDAWGVFEYEEDRPVRISGTVMDITERKAAEEALRISHERHQLLANNVKDVIWTLELDGTASYVSPSVEKLRGFTPEEAMRQTLEETETPDSQAISRRYIEQIRSDLSAGRTPEPFKGELEYRCKDGSTVWTEVMAYPLLRPDGTFLQLLGVSRDLTERKRYELELKQARDAAEAASAAKSQFLAHMSHEIRTPMNGVLGMAQLLGRESLSSDQLDMVQQILDSGKSLLNIINDILDLSKIESGQFQLERRSFDLIQALTRLERMSLGSARAKGIGLRVETAPELAGHWLGDALRLEQVLFNLVGNAIKFTEQGEVDILARLMKLATGQARVRFEVKDTGIGMTPEAIAHLFTPFSQADSSISRRFGGTGLGLVISKRLVELMGGEIGVESTPGVGSTFWFELPLDRAEADAEKAEAASVPIKGPRLQGLRLLVVDDSQINLTLAERALQREGAKVTLMKDGQQAVDCLRANPEGFDLVLMDIQMPVMDGLTATRAIRNELQLDKLPVIALTAGVLPEERQNALDAGINDFLPKPMDLDQMAGMISRYCRAPESL